MPCSSWRPPYRSHQTLHKPISFGRRSFPKASISTAAMTGVLLSVWKYWFCHFAEAFQIALLLALCFLHPNPINKPSLQGRIFHYQHHSLHFGGPLCLFRTFYKTYVRDLYLSTIIWSANSKWSPLQSARAHNASSITTMNLAIICFTRPRWVLLLLETTEPCL